MSTNITYIQGADFDILATDIKSSELIGNNIINTASPSLIVSFPKDNSNCELLVTNDQKEIMPIVINNEYNEPLINNNNNILLCYNSSYLNTYQGKLTLSDDVINKINSIHDEIKIMHKQTNLVNDELEETQNTISEMSNIIDKKYIALTDAILSKQIKYANNIDESVTPLISEENIFEEKEKIYDIAGNIYFDLNKNNINIGKNSILKFSGGTISNGKLIGLNTEIIGSKYKLFNNCKLDGTFTNDFLPEWFGAVGDGINDDSLAINTLLSMNIKNNILFTNNYLCKNKLSPIKNNICISGELDLHGLNIEIENVKLIFNKNGKIKNGKIKFNHTEIISDNNQIFENIIFIENSIIANDIIKVEWFGAKADGKTDDSSAINTAIDQVYNLKTDNIDAQPTVLLSHNIYYIKNTIHIYRNNSRFKVLGTIITNDDIVAIEICGNNVDININAIKNRKLNNDIINFNNLNPWENPKGFIGTALCIQQTTFNSKISINIIDRYKTGIKIAPRLFKDHFDKQNKTGNKYHPDDIFAGIQYCEFNFSMIHAKKCLEINIAPNKDSVEEQEKYIDYNKFWIWVNENNFNGGRFLCVQNTSNFNPSILGEDAGYGIYMVEGNNIENPIGLLYGGIDGNMFNHIGFEGLWQAIKLWKCKFHMFNDIRMCESLYAGTIPNDKDHPWIDLTDCENCNFNIKGLIPMDKLLLNNCRTIKFTGLFTEPYDKSTKDIFGTTKNRFTKLYGDNAIRSHKENNNIIIDDDPSKIGFNGIIPINELSNANIINNIYAVKNKQKYNFNNLLFKHIKYSNIDCNSFEISTICKLKVQAEKEILIDFKDSIWTLRPEMLINIELEQNASVSFVYDNIPINLFLSNENKITKSGNYKVVYQLNQINIEDSIAILQV